MTRFDPSLMIRRMVIERANNKVYDERFHAGVNIIRGENSSGKSTILNFIHYGLGGDVNEWSETALLCERVTIEVQLSGKVATLSRLISASPRQAMEVFFGNYDDAVNAGRSQWERYPYIRSQSKESFSQVLFRLLDIPEAASEDSGNITMHQVMRLLYGDQLSPVDELFAHEGFDNSKIREAVGRLLCGAFDNELYGNELEIRDVGKRYDSVAAELNSLYKALGQAGHDLTLDWVAEQRVRNEAERQSVENELTRIQKEAAGQSSSPTLKAQEETYLQLVDKQKKVAALREEKDSIELAMADSDAFIRSLEEKLTALKDSALIAQEIGTAQFTACPACYAAIIAGEHGVCALCKAPYDDDIASERIGGLINETALQLRQSKLLQEDRVTRFAEAESSFLVAASEWQAAANRYTAVQKRPTNENEHRLNELYKRLGYLDRRDEDITEKAKMIEVVNALSTQKRELNDRLSWLKGQNEKLVYTQRARLADAYMSISDNVRILLSKDLKRQDSFENPQKVDFSFADNKISVDGHTYFSASSRAFLKSAFLFGFHSAATQKSYFRHPRFVMLDTIEDKGMEAPRSQNFQRLVVEFSEAAPSQSQVILGTAMIAEELNNDAYVVGRFYTRDNRSLDFG
ncbi:ATP-binding protein [Lysobacter antibioticus]|uniref:ATP-binding protein n=1 Tax=Lysobacter antibioticus TaxID=84531 RepID=UPI00055E2CA7|nr:ATP-binding protein [Lysobacter antibioticus]